VAIATIDEWAPGEGSVVSWHPSARSLAAAEAAPVSTVPVSYMQAQHIRGFHNYAARGLDYSRLVIGSWDVPGRCDIRAMSYVINAHLRRHDTYRSWFQYDGGDVVRRTIAKPSDIKFVPTEHGTVTPAAWQRHILSTPSPLEWGCFSFGIIQREDSFTFYVIVDHVHTDPTLMGVLYAEIHMMYTAVVGGGAPIALPEPSGYDDFCIRQHQYTSALTLDSPEVRQWIDYAESNGGALPDFRLPLGDTSVPRGGDIMVVQLMDQRQTAQFEKACMGAGARFIGGVFACAALAECQLTGAATYYAMTPTDMRSRPEEYLTTGWFTGMIPVSVPVEASFGDTARGAQKSFDSNAGLAKLPFDRVLELAPWLRRAERGSPMLCYLDAGLPPLSAVVSSQLDGVNASTYCDARNPAYVCMWVGRLYDETSVTVFFPNNPVARDSVTRYVGAMKSIYVAVAEGRDVVTPLSGRAVA
jgi:hypothetical protein